MKKENYSQEVKFCVRYLLNHGINSTNLVKVQLQLSNDDTDFNLVPVSVSDKDFFDELATKLREMWPPGEKDGKYAWRDSVSNLSRRLKYLWGDRFRDKKFTIDECLVAARKYLAQFEDNVKYMQTLKYFIMKQKSLVEDNGRIRYVNESKFADILEGLSDQEKIDNEWKQALEEPTYYEGEII